MKIPTNTLRNNYLDIVKGVLIILVVVGHCIQHGSGRVFYNEGSFYENALFKFIYSFHMPLFMLLCGYFFAYTIERKSWQETLKSKLKSLLIPILVWSLAPIGVFALKLLKGAPEEITIHDIVNKVFHYIINNLWFLWAILYNVVIALFVNRLFKDNLWVYGALFVAQFFLPDALYLYCFMYPYFVLGYLYNKRFSKSRFVASTLQHRAYLQLATTILFFAMLLFFERKDYIYTSHFNILNGNALQQLGIDIFRFIIGLLGSLFMLFTIKYLHGCIGKHRGGEKLPTLAGRPWGYILYRPILTLYCWMFAAN